jgi:hypothetical protein
MNSTFEGQVIRLNLTKILLHIVILIPRLRDATEGSRFYQDTFHSEKAFEYHRFAAAQSQWDLSS